MRFPWLVRATPRKCFALRWPLSASKSLNAAKVRPSNNCPIAEYACLSHSLQQWYKCHAPSLVRAWPPGARTCTRSRCLGPPGSGVLAGDQGTLQVPAKAQAQGVQALPGPCSQVSTYSRCTGSLLYSVSPTAFCLSVVSGCFVMGVSPSLPPAPRPLPKRGPTAPGLTLRTPESAGKMR